MRESASNPVIVRTYAPARRLVAAVAVTLLVAFARSTHMMPRKAVEERIAATFPKAPAKRPKHKGKRNADIG